MLMALWVDIVVSSGLLTRPALSFNFFFANVIIRNENFWMCVWEEKLVFQYFYVFELWKKNSLSFHQKNKRAQVHVPKLFKYTLYWFLICVFLPRMSDRERERERANHKHSGSSATLSPWGQSDAVLHTFIAH